MKKVIIIILVFVYITVFFLGCNKSKNLDTSLNFSFDTSGNYTGFSDLPSNYTLQNAEEDGCYVLKDLEIISNDHIWEKFYVASLRNENTSIRIANFYTEYTDGPYFNDLYYEEGYYYLFDSSGEDQSKYPFSYLLTLEGKIGNPLKDSGFIVLTNDDSLTFDKVWIVMISSNMNVIQSVSPFKIVMIN
jgi:hypothetical protein